MCYDSEKVFEYVVMCYNSINVTKCWYVTMVGDTCSTNKLLHVYVVIVTNYLNMLLCAGVLPWWFFDWLLRVPVPVNNLLSFKGYSNCHGQTFCKNTACHNIDRYVFDVLIVSSIFHNPFRAIRPLKFLYNVIVCI